MCNKMNLYIKLLQQKQYYLLKSILKSKSLFRETISSMNIYVNTWLICIPLYLRIIEQIDKNKLN